MQLNTKTSRLAQSASALGAALLGFGLGAKWGYLISTYVVIIIVAGAVLHVWGIYVIMQMKNQSKITEVTARVLWISAWICLIALLLIIVYLLITTKN